jgi:hypothetical protein
VRGESSAVFGGKVTASGTARPHRALVFRMESHSVWSGAALTAPPVVLALQTPRLLCCVSFYSEIRVVGNICPFLVFFFFKRRIGAKCAHAAATYPEPGVRDYVVYVCDSSVAILRRDRPRMCWAFCSSSPAYWTSFVHRFMFPLALRNCLVPLLFLAWRSCLGSCTKLLKRI